jgi:DMSO/TMAO reductase YedYZ heme-binding membrane subunit
MTQALRQLIGIIIEGIRWALDVILRLWEWSWTQINAVFAMPLWNLATWKLVIGLVFMVVLAYILYQLVRRCLAAFEKIATAFWTMVATMLGIITFVVIAGAFSFSFQWVVRNLPDRFWERFL